MDELSTCMCNSISSPGCCKNLSLKQIVIKHFIHQKVRQSNADQGLGVQIKSMQNHRRTSIKGVNCLNEL